MTALAELGFTDSDSYSKDLAATTLSKELGPPRKWNKGELALGTLSFKKHVPTLSEESLERISQKYGFKTDTVKEAVQRLQLSISEAES